MISSVRKGGHVHRHQSVLWSPPSHPGHTPWPTHAWLNQVSWLTGDLLSWCSHSIVVSFSNIPITCPGLNTYSVLSPTDKWRAPTICMWQILFFILSVSHTMPHLHVILVNVDPFIQSNIRQSLDHISIITYRQPCLLLSHPSYY